MDGGLKARIHHPFDVQESGRGSMARIQISASTHMTRRYKFMHIPSTAFDEVILQIYTLIRHNILQIIIPS